MRPGTGARTRERPRVGNPRGFGRLGVLEIRVQPSDVVHRDGIVRDHGRVVGAEVPQFGGSIVEGKGEWAVVEACEAYDSFHDFDPTIVVLTNLEMDHADFHGTWQKLRSSVLRFVEKLPEDGVLVYCEEDAGASDIAMAFKGESRGYDKQTAIDVGHPQSVERMNQWIEKIVDDVPGLRAKFDVSTIESFEFPQTIFGEHNWTNASGASCAIIEAIRRGSERGLSFKVMDLQAAVLTFRGADRRMQTVWAGDIDVIDDYAHHPTEIKASIEALREMHSDRRLVIVYQPHLYSRTADLIPEFADALDKADHVFLTDIYPAREDPIPGVSSVRIAELMKTPVTYVPSRHLLPRKVKEFAKKGDVVVGMGAGSIESFAPDFIKELDRGDAKRVAVIYGGDSAEREVSILSGRAVHEALQELGYDSTMVDATELLLDKGDVSVLTGPGRPDVAFLCVHGTHAEDGVVQGFLELMHIPYVGSGLGSSAVAMDKNLTRKIFEAEGIPVPKGAVVRTGGKRPKLPKLPVVVKPNAQGSTVGLSFVQRQEDLDQAIEFAFSFADDGAVLVEEWVKGTEISVPVAGDTVLPVVEIVPQSGRYDFAAKYTPGATEEICPARITDKQTDEAQRLALSSHRALGCTGVTRTDMIVAKGRIVVLETNTLPGLTETSIVPRSAQVFGWSFNDLVRWMVEDALPTEKA
ncbi:MAG: D-alanine--D-alanine ligase [Armatimonadetes bacterium]|nr:D-alanine--D-alanine ligase [Armatimonadota bacterium]